MRHRGRWFTYQYGPAPATHTVRHNHAAESTVPHGPCHKTVKHVTVKYQSLDSLVTFTLESCTACQNRTFLAQVLDGPDALFMSQEQ